METINTRISLLIQKLGIKKTAFAECIGISQAFVSQLCAGVRDPSERTIADICAKYHVSEQWLRTGEGDMFPPMTRSQEIASFVSNVMAGSPDSDQSVVLSFLLKWTVEDWEAVAGILRRHGLAPEKEEPNP